MLATLALAGAVLGALILCTLGVAWGLFWALVRDQDGPYLNGKPADAGSNKWKEAGIAAIGLPAALLAWALYGWPEALVILALTAGAWTLPHGDRAGNGIGLQFHANREGEFHVGRAYLALAVTGGAVALGPALVLVWHGAFVLALVALLAGASKPLCYLVGWKLRGISSVHPHSTQVGHMLHGGVTIGVTLACLALGA